jgi:hypothetical protein
MSLMRCHTPILWLACVSLPAAVFDVTRYGAIADGASDAAPGIQAAIDAAAQSGGGTVLIPPASAPYLLRKTLRIRGHNIELAGPGATLQLADGAVNGRTEYTMYAEGSESAPLQRVTLRGFTLDANYFAQSNSRHSKAIVFRFVEHALVEDVTILGPYVGLSFRRGSHHAVARRVTVIDYQEDAFDAGGDADEVSNGVVRDVSFTGVVARDAPRCAPDGNAFEIEDGAQDILIDHALVDNVSGSGAVLRNHKSEGLENHSRDVELREVQMRGIRGAYGIAVRAAPSPSPRNTYK